MGSPAEETRALRVQSDRRVRPNRLPRVCAPATRWDALYGGPAVCVAEPLLAVKRDPHTPVRGIARLSEDARVPLYNDNRRVRHSTTLLRERFEKHAVRDTKVQRSAALVRGIGRGILVES